MDVLISNSRVTHRTDDLTRSNWVTYRYMSGGRVQDFVKEAILISNSNPSNRPLPSVLNDAVYGRV
jgi:hypothetical protein